MTTIDHQQAAVLAGAEALWKADPTCFGVPAPKTSAEWANETTGYTEDSRAVLTAAAPHLRAAWAETASDGYHTFAELYEYRMLYNAVAANSMPDRAVKSWRHSDGEPCFGGGWFVVFIDLPTGQVSNHYEAKDWNLFRVPEADFAPQWDGHTPQQAAERLRLALLEGGGE